MKELTNKVAVITGAASGIGAGMARQFAKEGMKLVLADIEEPALNMIVQELRGAGADVLPVGTDVSRRESVFALADQAFSLFGTVHVLCNNAGVSGGLGHVWEIPEQDWQWIMAVNFYGVLYGIQAFVPRMIAAGDEGVIINTTSVVGLTTGTTSVYGVTKHMISRITEGLYYDLRAAGSKLKAAVLVPGATATNILYADRNRPEALRVPLDADEQAAVTERRRKRHEYVQRIGMNPDDVGRLVVEALRDERFYIIADPERTKQGVRLRMEGILNGTGPDPEAGV
ncbi:MAG: SDR family NAD(P)-dependent oxidoreductase [Candidatus Binatia bacterium]